MTLSFLKLVDLLHRDLKPENIMLTSRFEPKIIDFGSADSNMRSCNFVNFETCKIFMKFSKNNEILQPDLFRSSFSD